MNAMHPPLLVQGALHFQQPAQISGWCSLPDQPDVRAVVEILVDGEPVTAMVAAQRSEGMGHGRNGFSLSLPWTPRPGVTTVIDARERGSATPFGRVVLCPEQLGVPLAQRLGLLDTSPLRTPIQADRRSPGASLAAALGELGGVLAQHGRNASEMERNRLRRCLPRLVLSGRPELSLIIPVSSRTGSTLALLTQLQPLSDTLDTEILLADDAGDPASLLLPQLIPELRHVRCQPGLPGRDLNTLVAEARGNAICFIDPTCRPGVWNWPQLDLAQEFDTAAIHLGTSAARHVARFGAERRLAMRRGGRHGIAFQIDRRHWQHAGGFDPALHGGVAMGDLAAKNSLLGTALTVWSDHDAEPRDDDPDKAFGAMPLPAIGVAARAGSLSLRTVSARS